MPGAVALFVRCCRGCGAIDYSSAYGQQAREFAQDWRCHECGSPAAMWIEVGEP
jgi:hypothetical protein